MTDPVDTDALRRDARVLAPGFPGIEKRLNDAADELERLRLAIENAPHENTRSTPCNAALFECAGCTCWKAGAR